MKVIMLDVDGVINSFKTTTRSPRGFRFVDDELIERIKAIIDATGAKVVLSSDWRFGKIPGPGRKTVQKGAETDFNCLVEKLKEHGIELFDVTLCLDDGICWDTSGIRQKECEAWAKTHNVEAWVAIDDNAYHFWEMYESGDNHFVCTSEETGITDEDVQCVISCMKEQEERNGNISD